MQRYSSVYWHFVRPSFRQFIAQQYGDVHGSSLRGVLDTPNSSAGWNRLLVSPPRSVVDSQWNNDVVNASICWERINMVNSELNKFHN